MGKRGYQPFKRNALEAAFEQHLKQRADLADLTVTLYMRTVHRFLKHVGDVPLNRVDEDVTRAFFATLKSRRTKQIEAVRLSYFLQWATARLPVPVTGRGAAMPLKPAVKDANEIALRQQWAVDKAAEQNEAGETLIVQLARKVIDHYLYFQRRIQGAEDNLDDIHRFAAECQELIQSNLPLFMSLSAQGRNLHPIIDERVQR